jgi:hypothetical protein
MNTARGMTAPLHRIARRAVLLAATGAVVPVPATAQTGDEPIFAQLVQAFKKPYFSVGMLVQSVADFQIERSFPGTNGFTLANARLNVGGELDGGFGYFFQTNFAGSARILDARLSYRPVDAIRISVGQFKAPFSYELLTDAASLDFVNRAQVVSALAPARQLGAEVALGARAAPVGFSAGVFNGNAIGANANDNNALLYVARFRITPIRPSSQHHGRLLLGVNAGFSRDAAASLPAILPTSFAGDRTLLGADARYTDGPLLLSGEVIYAHLAPAVGPAIEPWGFHATAGYKPTARTQVLGRWDRLDRGLLATTDLIIFGFNAWPTRATEVQVNYLFDTDQATVDNHRLLVNLQLGF